MINWFETKLLLKSHCAAPVSAAANEKHATKIALSTPPKTTNVNYPFNLQFLDLNQSTRFA